MNNFSNDDLETFLAEVQLTNQKVKALAENRMTTDQFDKLEVARAEDKKRRQDAVKRKQVQALEKIKLGREGKGITKDFSHFCRFCHWEYQMPTTVCLRCKRETMTLAQRQEQLGEMVEKYKDKKKKREERKMKSEMWQKTKSMLWKKTSNNYDKWEYFLSDSEEEPEHQPIVPKDDPNFKALQRDMQQRKAMRKKDTQKALKLKQSGNAALKEGDYQKAMEQYTLALEHIRDIKSIYTNRALAFIKLKRFKKAIKDCDDVIEYMQIFEKVQQNKDLVFKAYLRRSLAKKQRKQYKQALQDCKKALTFFPNNNEAQIMLKQIQGFIQHNKKVSQILRETNPERADAENEQEEKEKLPTEKQAEEQQKQIVKKLAEQQLSSEPKQQKIEQKPIQSKPSISKSYSSPIQQIKQRIQNLTEQNISAILKLLVGKPDLVSIFIAAKGIQKCLNQVIESDISKKQGYLISYCLKGDGVGEKDVWDFGIQKIHKKVTSILECKEDINISKYFLLQDIFEILIPMSLHEKYRNIISDSLENFNFLERTFSQLISRHKKQSDLFSSFLIYMGNLCSGSSKIRDTFITNETFRIVILSLFDKVITKKTANRSQLNLKKNVYSLFANLVINVTHRSNLISILNQKQIIQQKQQSRWSELVNQLKHYSKSQQNFEQYVLALLSLFANTSMGTSPIIQNLPETINQRFLSNPSAYSPELINRCLLVVSRLGYSDLTVFKKMLRNFGEHIQVFKKNRQQMQHIVRLLNVMYMPRNGQHKFKQQIPKILFTELKSYVNSLQHGEMLFCNTCNLFCLILDTSSDISAQTYQQLKSSIKFLIDVAKDKVGNWRKNASILLAKLSFNPECKDELYKHHGMDVLKSIAQFVKQK